MTAGKNFQRRHAILWGAVGRPQNEQRRKTQKVRNHGMTPIDFSNLEKHSKIINEGSDEVTAVLIEIQEKLNSLNLGVEVWLNENAADDEDGWHPITETETEDGWTELHELGYGKGPDGQWGLLVKYSRYREIAGEPPNENELDLEIETTQGDDFLLKAARHLRIQALDLIPQLVKEIEKRAEVLVNTIKKAEGLATQL